ncbi:MAG: MFS transporter [Planctomycetota bacterium]
MADASASSRLDPQRRVGLALPGLKSRIGLVLRALKSGIGLALRALKSRNYRLFFAGQSLSLTGTWMQRIALSWLVYRLTGSPWLLGLVACAGQLPTFLVAPFAGVLTDRWNLRRLVVATQALAMVQALLLAMLTLTHVITVWHLLALSVVLGLINAFDLPARQTFVVHIVEPDDLPNAIALNSALVNAARLVGPALAGLLISLVGEGWCFMLNGLSYVGVLAALLAMRIAPRPVGPHSGDSLHGLRQGFVYAYQHVPIRSILLLLAVVSLVGVPYAVLMPIFAREILGGTERTLGILMGASGVGALCGALLLAARPNGDGLRQSIAWDAVLFGAGLIGFAWSQTLWLALLMMALSGFALMLQMAASNTVLQALVDEDKRGRIMSMYTMAFIGMAPFGALLAGTLAGWIGAPQTVVLGGAGCMLAAFYFGRHIAPADTLQPSGRAGPAPRRSTAALPPIGPEPSLGGFSAGGRS